MSRKNVLLAAHDPGGTLSLAPVLTELKLRANVTALCSEYSRPRLDLKGLAEEPLPTNLTADDASTILDRLRPNAIITGTSWNSNAEQMLRNEAARRNVRSVVVIDYWRNYALRWHGASYPLEQAPDFICAVDPKMAEEISTAGFPKKNIFITGQPHLEQLNARPIGQPAREVKEYLFLSEPRPETTPPTPHLVFAVAKAVREICNPGSRLRLKSHPKEDLPWKLIHELESLSSSQLKLEVFNEPVVFPAGLSEFDFVIGYQTMGLFESASLGKPTIAIPHPNPDASLISALHDFGIPVAQPTEISIANALKAAGTAVPGKSAGIYRGATEAIVSLLLG